MSKNTVIPFSFSCHEVRVIDKEGSAWFVAADVCEVLQIKNVSKALEGLDKDEKGITNSDTLGGKQKMLSVNESGLWALVLRSRKAEAKKFRKWITSDVIPTIRKMGAYGNPALTAKETGGITKAVFKKTLAEFLPELLTTVLPSSGHSLVKGFKTSKELLVENGAVQKGRKSLVRKFTHALKKLCDDMGLPPMKDFYSDTLRFPPEVYTPFLKGTGAFWIRQHNALQKDNQPTLIK